jgi:hypothetical protein
MSFYLKDPDARVDYAIEWQGGYLDGQAVAASSWSVTPTEENGLWVTETSFDLTRTGVTVEGGISGHAYRLSNRVTLSDGRVDERSITLRVEER